MSDYFHSVTLDKDKCKGCTSCIKGCPTEAIRVRNGKARIMAERCIDCGECIKVCPYHAKVAITDTIDSLKKFKYKIALPAPTLYGQFKNLENLERVSGGLKSMGFDEVFDVARAAEVAAQHIKRMIVQDAKKPLISSACPAIVRLIQLRFPDLLDNIVDLESPMEIAGQIAREEFIAKYGAIDSSEIGVFFITPCAAKVTSIRKPLTKETSSVDYAISIVDLYGLLSASIKKTEEKSILSNEQKLLTSIGGLGWANSGGESIMVSKDNYLAVDGIHNVIRVLEEIENMKFTDLDFFEGLSCVGGCVGGPLVFENGYVAKNRIKRLVDKLSVTELKDGFDTNFSFINKLHPIAAMKLDEDLRTAIQKAEQIEILHAQFPGLDCGSCGSPNCKALAEDIVRGLASELDCVFKLREKVKRLAHEMIGLSEKIPGGEDFDNS